MNWSLQSLWSWESVQLLLRARLWSRRAAVLNYFLPRRNSTLDMSDRGLVLDGALATTLSVAFGAFTQELLVHGLFSSEAPSVTPGNIQGAQTWQNYTGNPEPRHNHPQHRIRIYRTLTRRTTVSLIT